MIDRTQQPILPTLQAAFSSFASFMKKLERSTDTWMTSHLNLAVDIFGTMDGLPFEAGCAAVEFQYASLAPYLVQP